MTIPPIRILNVDDTEAQRYALTRTLERAGFEVMEAGTGAEALALAASLPDVVLLDVKLPDISGLEVCRRLKSDPATANLPVIQISANFTRSENRVEGLNSGADAYLAQPVSGEEVVATIRSLVRRNRAEQKHLEEVIATEGLLTAVIEDAPVGVAVLDAGLTYQWANQTYLRFLDPEYQRSGVIGRNVSEVLSNSSGTVDVIRRVAAGGEPFISPEYVHEGFERGTTYWDLSVKRIASGDVVIVAVEITHQVLARKQVEELLAESRNVAEALRGSEERFRNLADNIAQLAWMADSAGWIFWYNKRWFDYTGTDLEQMQGWGWRAVHHPEHVDRVVEKFRASVASGEVWEDTFPLRGRDGVYRWFLSRAIPIRDAEGGVVRWFGTNTDITEQRNAEHTAERSLAQLRAIIDSMTEGVYVSTATGEVQLYNAAFARIYGLAPDVTPADVSGFAELIEAAELDGRPVPLADWPVTEAMRGRSVRNRHLRVRRLDGTREMILNHNVEPVRNEAGEVTMVVATIEDVTAMKKAESTLVQTEKLASVGRMAATIAHEINNPLAAVMNALFLISMEPGLSEAGRQHVKIAEEELARVSHITKQTLGFYRESGAAKPLALGPLVDGVLDLYGPRLRARNVAVEKSYRGGEALAIAGEVRQVVSNLLANSLDAVSDDGRLQVRTRRRWDRDGNQLVSITVADNGGGIAPEHRKRLFEPFFTTKQTIGTGLGLWVSRDIVRKHGGNIRVKSAPGRGTAFTVFLRAARNGEEGPA